MVRLRLTFAILIATGTVTLFGCTMPKMTMDEFRAMQPEKPAELERLNMFVGSWTTEGTGTFAMLEEPVTFTGENTFEWSDDGWCLVNNETMEMADMDPMGGIGLWTYDPGKGKYVSFWAGSWGSGTGDAKYDDETGTWHMRGFSSTPQGKSTMTGTVHFVDDDTSEWTFTESMGLMKIMDMTATSRRVE